MCGIVGYTGSDTPSQEPLKVCLEGLERLEYRGYDSAGVVGNAPFMEHVVYAKKAGRLKNLLEELHENPLPDMVACIGHTRWATNGEPSDINAHPQFSQDKKIAIIHNGIIENAPQLKAQLESEGYVFESQTDTEVAAKLLGKIANTIIETTGAPDLFEAIRRCARELQGTFAILAVDVRQAGAIAGIRHDSPMVIGKADNATYFGSDVTAFVSYTRDAIEVAQDEAVFAKGSHREFTDFNGNPVIPKEYQVTWDASAVEKGGWNSFMEKEIHEDPLAVSETLLGRVDKDGKIILDEIHVDTKLLSTLDKIVVIACGTAAYSGMVAKYAIERWVHIPVEIELAHEFRYRDPILTPSTLVVAISQSGETMDTLMALRHAHDQGALVLSICNTQGSMIPRESDAVLYTHAGPEVAVASTKAFVAQITAAYILGLYLAQVKNTLDSKQIADIIAQLRHMPQLIEEVLQKNNAIIQDTALKLQHSPSFLFLGRYVGYPIALEGALKLKEIAYTFTQGFAAGELKHGPIALIEEGTSVVVIVPSWDKNEVLHSKVITAIQEVKARGAFTIAVAEEGDEQAQSEADVVFWRPDCPVLMSPLLDVVPLQLFALDIAQAKGVDIDRPRNLAKAVTVE